MTISVKSNFKMERKSNKIYKTTIIIIIVMENINKYVEQQL